MKKIQIDKSQYTPVTRKSTQQLWRNFENTSRRNFSKFKDSLQEAMIGSIVQNVTKNVYTPLQVSLGLLLHEKKYITELSKYSICRTYDETKRFKQSAAMHKQFKGTVLNSND